MEIDPTQEGFRGTQVRDDGKGPMLVAHRQRLVVVEGQDRGLEREFSSTRVSIGTSLSNDFVITDTTVSRAHCEIVIDRDRYLLRDLHSTNGTSVNGTPVMEAYLSPGARIRIGETEMLFEPKKKWERIPESKLDHFGELYGRASVMRSVFGLMARVGPTDLSCIIHGETGTGKELAAHAVHCVSHRADKPFVVVDCGAISHNLIESELFGHERGAFTGADRARAGAFELADGGTIFLDEIGELPLGLQPKLLRALERREVKRLGASASLVVNVRVIAATHRDLLGMIRDNLFREDLYYRLAEVVLKLPPLRSRKEDIPLLAERIVREQLRSNGASPIGIAPDALSELQGRPWPGNVRELRNVIRRAVALSSSQYLTLDELKTSWGASPSGAPMPNDADNNSSASAATPIGDELPIKEAREQWVAPMEKEYLSRLLQRCDGDLDAAAEQAGLHRKSLERLLRQHGIKASALKPKR